MTRPSISAPHGLKPESFSRPYGTAEAVPFPAPRKGETIGSEASNIKEVVKQKYGEAALRVTSGGSSYCGATASTGCCDPITSNLYDASQAGQIPEKAILASLGCGNPTALAT